ncbi:SDR family oxidoreductase [Actinocorallia lasiicapitis]
MGTLEGKTALVTGGSRGIGRGIAERLAAEGALVAVHYGSNEAAADATLAAIKEAGGAAFGVRTKLGEPGDAQALWASFDASTSGVDIIVNNAGVITYAPISDTDETEFDAAFAVNARAPFFLLKHGLSRLRDGGRIINISSAAARIAMPITVAYSMTKGALDVLTHTLALELGQRGITVNSVAPGVVDTDIASWLADPGLRERAAALSALHRIGETADIADVVAFLASPDARWVTGQTIDASGGTLLGFTL